MGGMEREYRFGSCTSGNEIDNLLVRYARAHANV
jgi:hypothetical protein